jgi:GTP-binding protein
MKFLDETLIVVEAGCGGDGCVSFRREKYIPKGGPDGGDGGKGGNVILKATNRLRTLSHFHFRQQFKAPNGTSGQGKNRTGKNGKDFILDVPVGTLVKAVDSGVLLKDLARDGESIVVARGGRGGKGNKYFASSTHRTPRFAQKGEPGGSISLK